MYCLVIYFCDAINIGLELNLSIFGVFCVLGILLPELVVSVVLLLSKNAGLMQEAGAIPLLAGLLEHLDRFNHLAPGKERDDNEDLAWPGIMGMY